MYFKKPGMHNSIVEANWRTVVFKVSPSPLFTMKAPTSSMVAPPKGAFGPHLLEGGLAY